MNWMLLPLKRYATFTGRARPKEYWLFALFVLLGSIVAVIAESLLGIGSGESIRTVGDGSYSLYSQHMMGWLSGLFSLAMILPSLAVAVRRLHDTDRSGWWLLIAFVPVVGTIALFIFFVTGGTRGQNRFGPDPVEVGEGGAL